MNASDIVAAFKSGDIASLFNALHLTGVELIPTPEGPMRLGTVGGTGVVVSPNGSMVLHGHGENAIQAQACQATMSRDIWSMLSEEIMSDMVTNGPAGYEGRHVNPE